MVTLRTLAATGLLIFMASPAFAANGNNNQQNGNNEQNGNNGNHGQVVGVPGPIAGIGLPILAIAGGYVWIRRQRQKNQR